MIFVYQYIYIYLNYYFNYFFLQKTVRINPTAQCQDSEEDNFSDVEDFEPVDIDVNTFQHILKSYQEQLGLPGPASNLLGPAGLNLGQEPSK